VCMNIYICTHKQVMLTRGKIELSEAMKSTFAKTTVHEMSMAGDFIKQNDVIRLRSRIPCAGSGLFACTNIPKNAIIGEYTGKLVDASDCKPEWSMHTSKGHMIDASTSRRTCMVRFINETSPLLCNCISREMYGDGRVFIVAKCPISAGSELYYYYGSDYPRKW
jgi:hypothetical protein